MIYKKPFLLSKTPNLSKVKPVDTLTFALNELRMQSTLFCRAELSAPWGFSSRYEQGASFYIVMTGRCWLEVEGAEPHWLSGGDFVVLPHCPPHTLRDAPGTPTVVLESLMDRTEPGLNKVLRVGNGNVTTTILGGCFWFEQPQVSPLLQALPPVLYVAGEKGQVSDWLQTTLAFVAAEANGGQPGAQSVITHLSGILFIQAIRSYLNPLSEQGNWLGALIDPEIGQALGLIHQHLEYPWTVEELAARLSLSRSSFAARFVSSVGEPPLRYVTRWRIQQAVRLLRSSNLTLAEIATRVGYSSEMAFSKAFQKWMSIAPGAYRRQNINST